MCERQPTLVETEQEYDAFDPPPSGARMPSHRDSAWMSSLPRSRSRGRSPARDPSSRGAGHSSSPRRARRPTTSAPSGARLAEIPQEAHGRGAGSTEAIPAAGSVPCPGVDEETRRLTRTGTRRWCCRVLPAQQDGECGSSSGGGAIVPAAPGRGGGLRHQGRWARSRWRAIARSSHQQGGSPGDELRRRERLGSNLPGYDYKVDLDGLLNTKTTNADARHQRPWAGHRTRGARPTRHSAKSKMGGGRCSLGTRQTRWNTAKRAEDRADQAPRLHRRLPEDPRHRGDTVHEWNKRAGQLNAWDKKANQGAQRPQPEQTDWAGAQHQNREAHALRVKSMLQRKEKAEETFEPQGKAFGYNPALLEAEKKGRASIAAFTFGVSITRSARSSSSRRCARAQGHPAGRRQQRDRRQDRCAARRCRKK